DAVAQRVHLDGEADIQSLAPKLDQAVDQLLPVAIRGKIVVGDEEALDALGDILAHEPFEIVSRSKSALATLHVDDSSKGALIGAAPTQIDARQRSRRAAQMLAWQDPCRLASERRQIFHVVVERRQLAIPRIAEHLVKSLVLRFSRNTRESKL